MEKKWRSAFLCCFGTAIELEYVHIFRIYIIYNAKWLQIQKKKIPTHWLWATTLLFYLCMNTVILQHEMKEKMVWLYTVKAGENYQCKKRRRSSCIEHIQNNRQYKHTFKKTFFAVTSVSVILQNTTQIHTHTNRKRSTLITRLLTHSSSRTTITRITA